MLELIKYTLIYYSLSFSTMIFYKITKTYQLAIITISALYILLLYPTNIFKIIILTVSCVIFVLLYSLLFYWLNKKSLHYKFDFDVSIIEIAIYSIFTYILFLFFTRERLDDYLLKNYFSINIFLLLILISIAVISAVYYFKKATISKIKLWADNQIYFRTIFTEKECKRMFISSNFVASIMFILSILLLSLDTETQINYGVILEYYIYGLAIWFISGDNIFKILICSILLAATKFLLWEHIQLNENWIFFILLTLGVTNNFLKEKNVRLSIFSNIAD